MIICIFVCNVHFSDAEVTIVSLSETIQDHPLMAGTSVDSCKMQQCDGSSHPGPGPDVKLTIVNVDTKDDAEMVECQLETAKHTSVSFKFNRLTDQPSDVAASLVCHTLHVSPLSTADSLHTHYCFNDHFPHILS